MLELDRPSGEAQGAVIRYEVGVDCEVKGEVNRKVKGPKRKAIAGEPADQQERSKREEQKV